MSPNTRTPLPAGFSPNLFSHGRVLYRYPGSDACRFSPALAYRLIEHIPAGGPATLWDPFCGSGLILAIAGLFFPGRFESLVGSDVSPEAVDCTRKNLELVLDPAAARRRLEQLRGMQKMNAGSHRRWGAVAGYLETLIPEIEKRERAAPQVRTFVASAFALPAGTDGEIHFVGDLPYGRESRLDAAEPVERLFERIAGVYPRATIRFVMTREIAERFPADTGLTRLACRGGRRIVGRTP